MADENEEVQTPPPPPEIPFDQLPEDQRPAFIRMRFRNAEFVDIDLSKAIKKSSVIADMVHNTHVDLAKPGKIADDLDCHVGSYEALKKVAEWLTENHDRESPKPANMFEKKIHLSEADLTFFNFSSRLLVDVMKIANYLDIDDITEIASQKIANMAKDKSAEQMRAIFMLPNDLTADQKATIREKHSWAASH